MLQFSNFDWAFLYPLLVSQCCSSLENLRQENYLFHCFSSHVFQQSIMQGIVGDANLNNAQCLFLQNLQYYLEKQVAIPCKKRSITHANAVTERIVSGRMKEKTSQRKVNFCRISKKNQLHCVKQIYHKWMNKYILHVSI